MVFYAHVLLKLLFAYLLVITVNMFEFIHSTSYFARTGPFRESSSMHVNLTSTVLKSITITCTV